jgi:hypothetical protein
MWEPILAIVLGAVVAALTLLKPAFFWEHRRARTMRRLIGDTGTTVLYLGISLVLLGLGIASLI